MRCTKPNRASRSGREVKRNWWLLGLAALALAICALHLRPLILWSLQIAPELRGADNAERLYVPRVVSFPVPASSWVVLRVGDLSLKAAIPLDERGACEYCAEHCLIPLERGKLAILPERAPESYRDALDTFGPDERDLSPFRSTAANWSTIESLAARVRSASRLPESFRFETGASKGIVTVHQSRRGSTFVIYPYALDGTAQRAIGLTGQLDLDAQRIIGSIATTSSGKTESSEQLSSSDCRAPGIAFRSSR
jgi:hypothetical protein